MARESRGIPQKALADELGVTQAMVSKIESGHLQPTTQMVSKLANLQKNFGKKMNSPGVDLSLRKIRRWRAADRTLVKYELYAIGLPTNVTYALVKIQINGTLIKQLDGIALNSDGRAICAGTQATCKGSAPNSPIELVFFAGKSEPIRETAAGPTTAA